MDSRQHAPLPVNPVGDLLRGWRNRRAMSQADLAFEAGISIKHLSYVETGKAAGSRDILLQLASALGLSLRDRNALLEAGGFARQYGERDLSAPEVADAKRAIDLLLQRHEPFPAIVTDRRWNVMQANRAATRLMTMLLGEARMTRPLNHMRMFLAPDELRPYVVDWPDVAAALMARARHEAMAAPLDLALQSTWRELLKLPDVAAPQLNETDAPGPLCEVRLKENGKVGWPAARANTRLPPLDAVRSIRLANSSRRYRTARADGRVAMWLKIARPIEVAWRAARPASPNP